MKPSLQPPGRWWNWPRKPPIGESPHYKELLQLLNEFEVEYLRLHMRREEERDREGYSKSPHAKDESILWEAEAAWPEKP